MQHCFATPSLLLFRNRAKYCASIFNAATSAHSASPMAQKTVRNPASVVSNGLHSLNHNHNNNIGENKQPADGSSTGNTNNNTNNNININIAVPTTTKIIKGDGDDGNDDSEEKNKLPYVGKNPDGTWGPYGLYCGRIPESRLISVLRSGLRPKRLERIERVLMNRCSRVTCVFENLSDPQNGAACLRTMESFGLTTSHTIEAYETFRISESVSKSAHKWIDNHRYRHCHDTVVALKESGHTIVATCLDEDAVPLSEVDFKSMGSMGKIAVCFGNEERGISKALRDRADHKVYIEMKGFTESFNISVSCALVLMHLRNLGLIQPDLNDEEITSLYKKWLLMSTKKAITLLKRHGLEDEAQDYI